MTHRPPSHPRRRRGTSLAGAASGLLAGLLAALSGAAPAAGEEAIVAVAANFAEVAEVLEERFEKATGHTVTLVTGSTGKIYSQIALGAPFDVFLSADQERPERLERDGLAVAGSRFTYATGRLILWSRDPGRVRGDGAALLRRGGFRRLAIANPDLAPYGAAARQTLEKLGLWESLRGKVVMGETIGQAHAMVASGNAEVGFVALSYVVSPRNETPGSRWDVPAELHAPLRQDAVLLTRAAGNAAARGFLDFLRRQPVRALVESYGYAADER